MIFLSQLSEGFLDCILIRIPINSKQVIAIRLPAVIISFGYGCHQKQKDQTDRGHGLQVIIIMFNSVNSEILNDSPEEKLELPQLKTGMRLPVNYIREYFQLKTLISIPHIDIAAFYHKIHTIRTIFITEIADPKLFLVNQYNFKLSVTLTDNIIHSSRQIIRRIQSLDKSKLTYQEETDSKKTRRVYFGEISHGKKEGYGIYAEYQIQSDQENGSHFYFYEGFFSQNYKNGLGIQWSQNRIFIGQFINNTHFSHSEAIFLYNNGDIYVGSIFNYKRNGRGVLFQSKPKNNKFYKYETSQRFSQYESIMAGNWEDDQISRKNKFMLTTQFKEIFSINLYDYQSNLFVKSTSVYVGDIKHQKAANEGSNFKEVFKKQGRGFEHFNNGDIYKGQYINDKPQGYGHYIWSNKEEYHGQFMKGQREGSGQWKGENGELFEGQYHKDERNGYGIYRWPNGNVYEGEFKNDNRNGIGKMTWANGQIYMGKWKDGVQHGQGEVRAHLFSYPIKKQFFFENGKAVKSQSARKELNELKLSPKRKFSNKTNKQKKQQSHSKKKFSMDSLKTKANKQLSTQLNLHPSFYKSVKNNTSPTNKPEKAMEDRTKTQQIEEIGNSQEENLKRMKTNSKFMKKEKLKSKIRPKMLIQNILGETLLKPIKWTNFNQNKQQQI